MSRVVEGFNWVLRFYLIVIPVVLRKPCINCEVRIVTQDLDAEGFIGETFETKGVD